MSSLMLEVGTSLMLPISSSEIDKMEEQDRTNIDPTPLFGAPPPRMQSLDDIAVSQSPSQPCQSSVNSCQEFYTPQVKNEVIPKIDQQFLKLDDVWEFYNEYARQAGFSVRINSSRLGENGKVMRKEYVCFKEGERKNSKATKRRRGLTREKCGAKFAVVRKGEVFVVSKFVKGHNHELTTPRKVHLLKSHRRVSAAQKALTQQLSAANVPTCQQMSIFELQAGGIENVGFLARDLYNDERDRKNVVHGHDANILYEHFEMEQQKNPGFRFTFERDDKDRMTHCFWVDAASRKSYQYFGDVVVFDTTYYTNKYSLIFAPILRVNHHRQTTLLGCAFLSDEKTDSFVWLFNEWLKAMPGGPPKMIITDQDPAMTSNCFCSSKYLKNCIWNSETPGEFDARWATIVGNSKLSSNKWLQDMYEIRDRWIPAYTNHMFSAHMTSSQRVEISHSFFKRYVSKENSMMDFVTRFNRALAKVRHNELNLDHKDVNEKPLLKASWAMEKKMSEIYTRSIFERFQEEIFQINAYVVTFIRENEHWCLWNVQREETEGARTREISVDKSSNLVSCSGVKEICNSSLLVRRQGLFQLACTVIDDAVLDEEESEVVREALESSQMKIALMRSSRQDGSTNRIQVPPSLGSQHSLKEPLQVRAKGCDKRLKGGKEKAVNKMRKCNGCGLTGQSHDKRNCPKLMNMSSQDVRLSDDEDDVDDECKCL
ncbi:protein FAR1-RELATED SEQUENCE 5-like [Rhododendron vialii]|uniref:protein FAR1-RELATED SEQUENCE 5-like n=1 Tax=Rhododendron vialii TaxID=182163 RepID=UPI00265E992D|nr:protein FAR1-RELATED SEQUENCE 5-like [Rhododendron vialii]